MNEWLKLAQVYIKCLKFIKFREINKYAFLNFHVFMKIKCILYADRTHYTPLIL